MKKNLHRIMAFLNTPWASRVGFFVSFAMWLVAFYFAFNPEDFVKLGYLGVFIFNLAGPGTVLIPLVVHYGLNMWLVAVVTALGMTFNDSVSFLIGRCSANGFYTSQRVVRIVAWVGKYDMVALFILALVPFPLDFVAMVVGHAGYPYKRFLSASIAGKFFRAVLLGGLTLWFGQDVIDFVQSVMSSIK